MSVFNEVVNRKGTYSVKWMDEEKDQIPMWVADMDFKSPNVIISRLIERVGHGIYGYTYVPDAYFDAVMSWSEKRHGLKIEKEWIIPSSGVVPSISAALAALINEGDSVLIQPPVYNAFYRVLEEMGYKIIENPLQRIEDRYSLDLLDFESKIKEEAVKVFVLCNPHNPVGRSWNKEDLVKMGEICHANGVTILADEIHRDLILKEGAFVPFLSLGRFNDITVSLTSPSKTFNLGGVQVSNLVIPNKTSRDKVSKVLENYEISSPNLFGIEALIAGYTEGEKWLDELLDYIDENRNFAKKYLDSNLVDCSVIKMDSTYLMWLDTRGYQRSSEELNDYLIEKGVRLNSGNIYGQDGDGYLRINLATPRALLQEGLKRIVDGLKEL